MATQERSKLEQLGHSIDLSSPTGTHSRYTDAPNDYSKTADADAFRCALCGLEFCDNCADKCSLVNPALPAMQRAIIKRKSRMQRCPTAQDLAERAENRARWAVEHDAKLRGTMRWNRGDTDQWMRAAYREYTGKEWSAE